MRKTLGIGCIVLGLLCLIGSVGFVLYNRWEAQTAAESSSSLLADAQQIIAQQRQQIHSTPVPEATQPQPEQSQPAEEEPALSPAIPAAKLDGYDCLGVLTIPVLELELPVLADWTYEKLRKAPCQYYGNCYDGDFVIAGHNYASHFGKLSSLRAGDLIVFTDIGGNLHCYEVALLETLPPTATEEMITSGFDLSLYTCTPGGSYRVTVRCRKTDANSILLTHN